MDFGLNEQQEMLKKMARDFLEKECPEAFVRQMEKDSKGYSPEQWKKVAELGWLGLVFPEEYGGLGGSVLDMAVLYDEMGRAMFPSPHLSTVVLCGLTILSCGSAQQKAELLPRIAEGKLVMSLALTEPNAIYDAEGVTVQAKADGDGYIINGTKLFVHDAHVADYLLCVTRTRGGAAAERGITLFLVDARSPGISYTLLKTTSVDNKQSEVIFDNVRVPRKNMVGKLNGGWAPLYKVLQIGAVMLCAEMVGAGQKALELAVDYAKTRVQFEEPIGVNQFIQDHCIYCLAGVDGSRFVTYQAAWRLAEGLPCDMEVAIAKAHTGDAIEHSFRRAHEVFAGIGAAYQDHVLPLYTRRAKISQLYLGDPAFHRKKIAKEMDKWTLEMPRGKPLGLWNIDERDQIPAWTANRPGMKTS